MYSWVQWIASSIYASVAGYLGMAPVVVRIDVRNIVYRGDVVLCLVAYDLRWRMYGAYYLGKNGSIRLLMLENNKDPLCCTAIFVDIEPMSETIKHLYGVLKTVPLDLDPIKQALIDSMRESLGKLISYWQKNGYEQEWLGFYTI